MLIYSNPFYTKDNGNGYEMWERDAICLNCHKTIDRQVKYTDCGKTFNFSNNDKDNW